MLMKKDLQEIKEEDIEKLYELIQDAKNTSKIKFILNNLGRLPTNFDGKCILPLLESEDDEIRFLAVKNIGKLSNINYFAPVSKIAKKDENSMLRREAVSSIGRMRSAQAISFLIGMLHDADAKVVLQAIRALLVFKSNLLVQEVLKKMIDHPNEMIQDVIDKEFYSPNNKTESNEKHTDSPGFMKNAVVHGDVREILKSVSDESIHLTFTSPPYYNARDYSIYQSYKQYFGFLGTVFKEIYRVTKEGRFFVLNTSPVIIPRVSRQHSSKRYPIPFDIHPYLIEMGWEFIDDIVWVKPEATAKKRNAGFLQHRKPLAYKTNAVTEYVMVYRKKTHKLLDWNMKQYPQDTIEKSKVLGDYESSNVWKISPTFDKVHSAVFPIELCNRVIKFYSYKGDLVFDPFAGSGTLGLSAIDLGRYFFLTEIKDEYVKRISRQISKRSLFSKMTPRILTAEEFKQLSERDKENDIRFLKVLENLNIPCKDFTGDIDDRLEEIFDEIFENSNV